MRIVSHTQLLEARDFSGFVNSSIVDCFLFFVDVSIFVTSGPMTCRVCEEIEGEMEENGEDWLKKEREIK